MREETKVEVLIAYCILKNEVDYFRKSVHTLFIDGGHCGDHWKILVASFLDCNHKIQPIGFELCQGESNTSWVTFLEALKVAGIKNVKDLMIYSDCAPAIRPAVGHVFPNAEWVPCAVHVNRELQLRWIANHGELSRDNRENVMDFNQFVGFFWKACISVTEEEKDGWMAKMEDLEKDLDSGKREEKSCLCFKYLKSLPEMLMYRWKFNHLMIRSSNPIESCMSMLKGDVTGTGSAREAGFFNRYRILIEWILICMHSRTDGLFTGKACLPVEPYKREDIMSPWVVSEVMRRAHYITMYKHLFEAVPCHKDGKEITDSKGECCHNC